MFDHIGLTVTSLSGSGRFYSEVLGALGYSKVSEDKGYLGFGRPDTPAFWLYEGIGADGRTHVAFTCRSRDEVDAFYERGIAAGARDNGAPGVRADYDASYYAAFLRDPDGNNIEAVCHGP